MGAKELYDKGSDALKEGKYAAAKKFLEDAGAAEESKIISCQVSQRYTISTQGNKIKIIR